MGPPRLARRPAPRSAPGRAARGRLMPAPATPTDLIELIRKSGVLDEPALAGYFQQPRPTEAPRLAESMVLDGLLTRFQAEQFLQGKWKRFHIGKYKVLERIGAGGMGLVFL